MLSEHEAEKILFRTQVEIYSITCLCCLNQADSTLQ